MNEPVPYFLRRSPAEGVVTEPREPFGEEREVRLQDYWRVLRKRGWMIATFLTGVVLATGVGLWLTTPVYTARAMLLIERRAPQVLEMKELLSESFVGQDDYDYYKTQYEILKSRSLSAQVIKQLDLASILDDQEKKHLVKNLLGALRTQMTDFFPQITPLLSSTRAAPEHRLGVKVHLIDTYVNEMLEIA